MSIGAYVFLFDSNVEGVPSSYGGYFDAAFFTALSSADPEGLTRSRIRRGDHTIAEMAERVTAVSRGERNSGHTISFDMPLYKSLVWDLIDALQGQWHTLDLDAAALIIANRSTHCIMLPTLPAKLRDEIDKSLRQKLGYVGAFEIDPGNPLQRRAFCQFLVYDAAVIDGQLVRERSIEGDENTPFGDVEEFKPNSAVWHDYGWLRTEGPPDLPSMPLSTRGEATASLIQRKRKNTVEERVLKEMAFAYWSDSKGRSYAFKEVSNDQDILQAILPDGKFTKYLFVADHKDNSGKAKFFMEELGIEPNDWRFLAAQFYEGLLLSKPRELAIQSWDDGYGAKFATDIRITGRNAEKRTVRTAWIMRPGQLPTLVTAFPGRGADNPVVPEIPPIVPPQLTGDEKWAALYVLAAAAGQRAQGSVVPTPMKIEGHPLIPDGACGSAHVTIKDARTGFARWLLKSGHGSSGYPSGASVFCFHESQSYERAKAYADAFARVLHWNGVPASVDARYT